MATLKGMPAYTGSMGGLSAYKMRGVDRIVLRERGGPTRQQVKNGKQYTITRLRNEEWKGSSLAVRLINLSLHGVRHLYDYNYSSTLSKVCRSMQDDDTLNRLGCRSILISQNGYKLDGFGLNKYHPFDTVLKYPLLHHIDSQHGTAVISQNDIVPAIHLTNPMKQPFCRLVFVLATVPDIVYDQERKMYRPATEWSGRCIVQTPWQISNETIAATEWQLAIPGWQPQPGLNLLLSAGIEYGQPVSGGLVQFTKYAGAAKVLKRG